MTTINKLITAALLAALSSSRGSSSGGGLRVRRSRNGQSRSTRSAYGTQSSSTDPSQWR